MTALMKLKGQASGTVVVFNDTRVDHHHGCSRVMQALDELIAGIGLCISAYAPAHSDWAQDPVVSKALESASLLLVNGEGTLHHNSKSGLKLLQVAERARALGIPSVLLNCGWQDNGPEFVALLRQFTLVSARDSQSATQMRQAGVSCSLVPDLSLYSSYASAPRSRQGVGFTDSVIRPMSLQLAQARRACQGLTSPIQFAPPGAKGLYRFYREYVGKSDLQRPLALAAMLGLRARQHAAQALTAQGYMDHLAGLELLVSGRFHACTLAMVARTPFIAVRSNSHKIEALISDAGLAPWRMAKNVTPEAIANARAAGWEPGEAAALDGFLTHARRSAQALFQSIAKLP
jgi:polysaccharide pyruvyl transferase WcaK-like protein